MHDPQSTGKDEFLAQLAPHQRRLYQYIFTLLPRQHDVDDVMQDTLMVLWQKFGHFQPGTSFFAWTKRIAYLQARNFRRRSDRSLTILDEAAFEEIATQLEDYSEASVVRQEALVRCADKLGPADRLLLNLRYVPGATVKGIAEQLGRPANSVRTSLSRIRKTLWECVRAETAAADKQAGECQQ
jgi:RNA polymerase sigma-70 factor (ECF subfamily)